MASHRTKSTVEIATQNRHAAGETNWSAPAGSDPAEIAALVRRVISSQALSNAPRSRQLLECLCGHAVKRPGEPLTEQQIGVEVFGRQPGFEDTIVRAQVSLLRKRLRLYFSGEGKDEPFLIDIPAGSYVPKFLARTSDFAIEPSSAEPVEAPETVIRRWHSFINWGLVAGLILGLALGWSLVRRPAEDNTSVQSAAGPVGPYLRSFWAQFWTNGNAADLVPSDPNALIASDFAGHTIEIEDYSALSYPGQEIGPAIRPGRAAGIVAADLRWDVAPTEQIGLAIRFAGLFDALHHSFQITPTRSFDGRVTTDRNIILLGHERAIPGEAPLAAHLNFCYRWDESKHAGIIVNTAPKPGERAAYVETPGAVHYSVVAYLPRPQGQGNVLILFGATVKSTDGAADLVTDEAQIKRVYDLLHLKPASPLPSFELLLARPSGTPHAEIAAFRSPSGIPAR